MYINSQFVKCTSNYISAISSIEPQPTHRTPSTPVYLFAKVHTFESFNPSSSLLTLVEKNLTACFGVNLIFLNNVRAVKIFAFRVSREGQVMPLGLFVGGKWTFVLLINLDRS